MSKISIIIPTHNCGHCIAEALNSVLKQDMDDYEIIIVDDGSKDNTRSIIANYIQNYPQKIKYFYQENQGAGSARNKGIKESKGEYIVFLDADDLILFKSLRIKKDFLDRNPSVGFVYSDYFRDNQTVTWLKIIKFNDRLQDFFHKEGSDLISNDDFFVKNLEFFSILMGTLMIRRTTIDTIGPFRVDLLNAQDVELIIRATGKYKVGYIDKPLYCYRTSLSQNTKNIDRYFIYLIKVFEEVEAQNINYKVNKIVKKLLSNFYFEYGYSNKQRLLIDNSRKYLLRSIIKKPFQIRSYKTFIGTFLPVKLRKLLNHDQN